MDSIQQFLAADSFAVAGATARTHKYGYKVFRALIGSGRRTYPLNPVTEEIDGHAVYRKISDLPIVPQALSIITPPEVTQQVIAEAIEAGVQHIWMQPGAEHAQASESAREAGINVIDDGSCILVLLARQPSNQTHNKDNGTK
ncbi:MAG: CoA-binding protein [Planctomycetota bacterium]